jgi:hypothetical protein
MAFMKCTSLDMVTLGSTPPTLGTDIFLGVSNKTVKVQVPDDTGYDEGWKTNFTHGGSNITLTIETL